MCDQSGEYMPKLPIVEIEYSSLMLPVSDLTSVMQELLTTFEADIGSVALVPSRVRPGGVFDIRLNGKTIWSRKTEGRFPEAKEIKQRVRDIISPEKSLGHSESAEKKVVEAEFSQDEKKMDDKTAEEQRRYFGVL
ncbi:hypothetical protein GUITHDRAFT_111608 [Guillardia theta CCMP2712]|uniref:Uncharacterized protein n=1 Tax=Guillardia theta (strain CCMP2712) TaxID=905079 RepID=L1J1D5_GUITC|nr:hypothetical protein GUITHDRAFT_111608 [Guillardia theta CCMP2712]EKX42333.1 hypothetical protein GUITHDRAFT_111608 [Guillardia theta CCMP2712]|eukprot:XP_005829313.1 hypothetical protein GUITHDRAFT_111608 [Guillardia theta CCMP2712]